MSNDKILSNEGVDNQTKTKQIEISIDKDITQKEEYVIVGGRRILNRKPKYPLNVCFNPPKKNAGICDQCHYREEANCKEVQRFDGVVVDSSKKKRKPRKKKEDK